MGKQKRTRQHARYTASRIARSDYEEKPKANHAARRERRSVPTAWESLAGWYDGWMGKQGSRHHRQLVIPMVRELLAPAPGERILEVGAGQGACAPCIVAAGASYVGVDASPTLIRRAQRHHGKAGRFVVGDARHLAYVPEVEAGAFDGVLFALSLQDMDPLEQVLQAAAWALRPGGRMVLILTHPCFRVPRQSGWAWDGRRKLHARRVDRYLTPLAVPLKPPSAPRGATSRSFHRPLQSYINGLAACGLLVERVMEVPGLVHGTRDGGRAEEATNPEIPLFLGLRARRP